MNAYRQTCSIILWIIIAILSLSLSITAIVISNKYKGDECISNFSGISFKYDTWLLIYGICELSFILTIITITLIYGCTSSKCILYTGIALCLIGVAFQFSWYIVGSILFFEEVNSSCVDAQPTIQKFGLALHKARTKPFWINV